MTYNDSMNFPALLAIMLILGVGAAAMSGNGHGAGTAVLRVGAAIVAGFFRLGWFASKRLWRGARWCWRRVFGSTPTTHGSARWADIGDVRLAKLLGKAGLMLGKYRGRYLRHAGEDNTLVLAPNRTGKGVSVVVPNLLEHRGSAFCVDIKGENYAITARRRRDFGTVHVLNLANPTLSANFNWLDTIRVGTVHEADDAAVIACGLVEEDRFSSKHWPNMARAIIAGYILHVCHSHANDRQLRTMMEVRRLCMTRGARLTGVLTQMACSPSIAVQEVAAGVTSLREDHLKDVLAGLDEPTACFQEGRPLEAMSLRSDFDLTTLKQTPWSLYLVVPPEKRALYRGYMRVTASLVINALTRDARRPPDPVLLLLDEAGALGYLEPIETAIGYISTYGRLMMIYQDLAQLKGDYPKWESIVANCKTKIVFGVADPVTARWVSDMVGKTTVKSRSHGQNQATTDLFARSENAGEAESARDLITPDEVLRLPDTKEIVFRGNAPAILGDKIRYYEERFFKGKFDPWRP